MNAAVADLSMTVEEFLAIDPAALPAAALGDLLVTVEHVARRVAALHAAAVRAFDARDCADADGAASTAAWLRDRLHYATRDARAAVGLARALDRLPLTAAALATGAVSAAHARILAAATRPLPPDTVAAGEAFLVEHARRFDPRRFATLVRRWVATVAPVAFERDTERRYDSRWLTVSPTYAGMWSVTGMLDPEAGALFHDAVDALVTANPADDVRTRAQQRADALGELVHLAHAAAALPTTGGHRPEVVVHVTADSLTGGERAPATLGDGTPLSRTSFERLACDATLRRLLLDTDGVPLDLGRATRVVPPGLRRYVALRDGGCRYPGCPRPAPYCDAHHVRFWRDGGTTSAGNLVLLCRYHHHLVHDRDHRLSVGADTTVTVTTPTGRTLISRPRGPTHAEAA